MQIEIKDRTTNRKVIEIIFANGEVVRIDFQDKQAHNDPGSANVIVVTYPDASPVIAPKAANQYLISSDYEQ